MQQEDGVGYEDDRERVQRGLTFCGSHLGMDIRP